MRIFVIHKGEDFNKIEEIKKELEQLKNQFNSKYSIDMLALESNSKFKSWKKEARYKINICDFVLFILGENTHKSENVDYEVKYALKKNKQILLYNLDENKKYKYNKSLFTKDQFTGADKPLYEEIKTLEKFNEILSEGFYCDIKSKLLRKDNNDDITLIEQYKVYLETSEEVLNRRQTVSNFYTTLNTSLITIAATVSGIIYSIDSLKNNYLLGSGLAFIICLIGILLCLNWLKLLDSYGILNGAKIRVISEIEKKLPANIFDTEWKVMSDKLGSKNYVSFTNIEKRVPKIFIGVYLLVICIVIAIVLFI